MKEVKIFESEFSMKRKKRNLKGRKFGQTFFETRELLNKLRKVYK